MLLNKVDCVSRDGGDRVYDGARSGLYTFPRRRPTASESTRICSIQRIIRRITEALACRDDRWITCHELGGNRVVRASPQVQKARLGVLVLPCEAERISD